VHCSGSGELKQGFLLLVIKKTSSARIEVRAELVCGYLLRQGSGERFDLFDSQHLVASALKLVSHRNDVQGIAKF